MRREIHYITLLLSCLTYSIVAMTTTLPPDYRSPEERQKLILEQKRLGMECQKTCRPETFHSTCHAAYPKSCTYFIMCERVKSGNEYTWIGTKMACSYGTFFSRQQKTCIIPELANCIFDKCRLYGNITSYASSQGCRTFWECVGQAGLPRISTPKCCKTNQSYSEELGKCVQDETCQDDCTLQGAEDKSSDTRCPGRTTWGKSCQNECSPYCVDGKCDSDNGKCSCVDGWIGNRCETACIFKKASKTSFMHGNYEIKCAPGTYFSEEDCNCISMKKSDIPSVDCPVLVYTNFTEMRQNSIKNWQGESSINYRQIEGPTIPVEDINQYGFFNGNAYAMMNFFSQNSIAAKTFATRIVFRPIKGRPTTKQVLMSNCASLMNLRNRHASLEIALVPDSDEIVISTYTRQIETGKFAEESFSLKYEPNSWTILDFLLLNKRMHAKTINLQRNVIDDQTYKVNGEIQTGYGLRLAKCDYGNGFVGRMAEVTISLCDPGLTFSSAKNSPRRGRRP